MVFAELVPNINEFFEWKGIFFKGDTWLEFNKTALMAFVSTAICIGIFAVGGRKRALVPTGLQNFAEAGYEMIETQVGMQVMGADDGKRWSPYLATLFFWIFFINIWSIAPIIQFPATSRLAIPIVLALFSWATFISVGVWKQGPLYMVKACFPPGVPKPLYLLVAPIEFVSKFLIRPFSLAVRLFANMTAGHVLLGIFAIMTHQLLIERNSGWWQALFAPLPFAGLVAMTAFEVLVAVLQAYIFTMLTAVYVAESLHPEH